MRKKIAVFVLNMYGAMINDVQRGLNEAAFEENVKLIYFASFSDGFSSEFYDQYVKYDEGDIVSFKLPDLDDFDGVIVITISFTPEYLKRIEPLLEKTKTPVLYLGEPDERFYSVGNADVESFKDVIEHVINSHGAKNIYNVAGPQDRDFSISRVKTFKETLSEYGLPADEDRIYYGTLWRDCGDPAVDYILEQCKKDGSKLPDAIVCANDFSAIGVIDACRERGINVPEDVIVTGFDGVEAASMGFPSVTTSTQPFFEMGREAISVFEKIWKGEDVKKTTCVKGTLNPSQSCGCVPLDMNRTEEIRNLYTGRMAKVEYLAQSTTNMILSISNAPTMEDVYREIAENAKSDTGFDTFLLCLAPGWDAQRVVSDDTTMPDEKMQLVCGFMGNKYIEPEEFDKKKLLPADLLDDPFPYYICSIHHLQYYMGYMIISPRLENYNQLMAKSWIVNLGAMLENWRIRVKLNDTVARLEDLSSRDMLTSLYNRRGYEIYFKQLFKECLIEEQSLTVMIIDMDNLKHVNDTFGHNEGDYSLVTIADAMMAAAKDGEICIRTGGDEFAVLAKGYNEVRVKEYTSQVRAYIQDKVKQDNKPYDLDVSVGACIRIPEDSDGVITDEDIDKASESYMTYADAEMYEEKKTHKHR